jgi:hypothetical protein
MSVDPTAALSDQLRTLQSPVNLRAIASALQNAQRYASPCSGREPIGQGTRPAPAHAGAESPSIR